LYTNDNLWWMSRWWSCCWQRELTRNIAISRTTRHWVRQRPVDMSTSSKSCWLMALRSTLGMCLFLLSLLCSTPVKLERALIFHTITVILSVILCTNAFSGPLISESWLTVDSAVNVVPLFFGRFGLCIAMNLVIFVLKQHFSCFVAVVLLDYHYCNAVIPHCFVFWYSFWLVGPNFMLSICKSTDASVMYHCDVWMTVWDIATINAC